MVVDRLNDAILLTRELVKQRLSRSMAILSAWGPGWYEGSVSEDAWQAWRRHRSLLQFRCVRPEQEGQQRRLEKRRSPRQNIPGINLNTNHVYTFEALLVAADAYKRAKSTDPKALADAIRATNITDNVSPGAGISFNEKGQNDKLKDSAIQNRGGKLVTVAPKAAANAKVQWPMLALRQAAASSSSIGAGGHLLQRRGDGAWCI